MIGSDLRVCTINSNDRAANHLAHVTAVRRGPPVGGVSGEAELVVDNEVQGPAHREPWKVGQGQGLCNNALGSKSSISMNLQAEHLQGRGRWVEQSKYLHNHEGLLHNHTGPLHNQG